MFIDWWTQTVLMGQLQRWSITSGIAWVRTGGGWAVWSMRWPLADRLSALAKSEWRGKKWRRGCRRRKRSTATSFQKTPKPSAGWWGHTHTHKHKRMKFLCWSESKMTQQSTTKSLYPKLHYLFSQTRHRSWLRVHWLSAQNWSNWVHSVCLAHLSGY